MKVAITSTGETTESTLDMHFGRCAYYIIYDTESKAIEIIPNPNKDLEKKSGQKSVELLESRNVSKIISGEFGLKIKPQLDRLKIQMIVLIKSNKKVQEIIEMLNH